MNTAIKTFVSVLAMSALMGAVQARDDDKKNGQEFRVTFNSLNGSGVYGKAKLEIEDGRQLKIKMKVKGFEVGKPHPQHIHGKDAPFSNATCPDISADVDADGLISVGEGLPSYGPVILPLVPFDTANESGNLNYKAEFTINPDTIKDLDKRTIVLHGMTVNGTYIASLPVACAQIERNN